MSSLSNSRPSAFAWWRRTKTGFDLSFLVALVISATLIVLVANPLLKLLLTSFEARDGSGFTLSNYLGAYGSWRHISALLNTLMMGAAVVLLSLVLALPLAWACARTDMPGKGFIRMCALGAFVMPPYLGAIAWILLAGPNAGWVNRFWMAVTGSDAGLINVFTFTGLVCIMAMNLYYFLFIFCSSALEMLSSEMEDAASILGAGPLTTARRVIMPLILPAILGGAIVTFLQSIALFGVPALISLPARFPVVVTQLWQFFEAPVRLGVAAAYSIPLLAITMMLFWLQKSILSRRGYVAVTGKGGERRVARLGRWRWVIFGYSMTVVTLTFLLPLVILLVTAFSKTWGRGLSFDNLTLANFAQILVNTSAQQALTNSFVYAAVAAMIASLLALAIAYIVARKAVPFSGFLAFLCVAPIVIPGVVLAIGFFAAYAMPPFSLYGTAAILVIAFVTRFLPIAYANSAAAMRGIHPEMEEAVRILGGSRLTAVRKVVAPLLKRSTLGGWILIFIPAAQELSTAIFLIGPNTRVLSTFLLDLSEEGNLELMSALGCVLLLSIGIIVSIGFRVLGRDFMVRRSA